MTPQAIITISIGVVGIGIPLSLLLAVVRSTPKHSMACPHCNAEVDAGTAKCPHCGRAIPDTEQPI
jgi:hypothetical protein